MSCVALIPARGGSKRIARKNLKAFDGVPMLARSIDKALSCGLFRQVVVSTDDREIAELALACGAEVPFIQPPALADDFTGTAAVIVHALQALREQGREYEYACCFYATAPLLQARYLCQGLEMLVRRPDKGFAFSVCGFGFPVQRALIIAEMSGNHNQSLEVALQIVEAAARAGAHALKLQTYTADTMTLDLDQGEFFIKDPDSLWAGSSLYDLYQRAHTPWKWHAPIFARARELGMLAFSTPFDESAVDFSRASTSRPIRSPVLKTPTCP